MWINYSRKQEILFLAENILSFVTGEVSYILFYCNKRNLQNGFREKKKTSEKVILKLTKKSKKICFHVFLFLVFF